MDLLKSIFHPSANNIHYSNSKLSTELSHHVRPLAAGDQLSSQSVRQENLHNVQDYLKLKREELNVIILYKATIKIQASWRSFLVRTRWNKLEKAAIKIQAAIRSHQLRRRWRTLVEDVVGSYRSQLDAREKAVVKIQSVWRGYSIRQIIKGFSNNTGTQHNETSWHPLDGNHNLENVWEAECTTAFPPESCRSSCSRLSLSSSLSRNSSREVLQPDAQTNQHNNVKSVSSYCSFADFHNETPESLENFVDKFPELIFEEIRDEKLVRELHSSLDHLEVEMKREEELDRFNNLNGKQRKILRESNRNQKKLAKLILNLVRLSLTNSSSEVGHYENKQRLEEDDIDAMFPSVPDRPDVIQPDKMKVAALKDAIRTSHQKAKVLEYRQLKKNHVMLRTRIRPGVYSDIYTTELTDMERKLKSFKFWKGNVVADTVFKREEAAKKQRLKRLFAHALKICSSPNSNQGQTESDHIINIEEDSDNNDEVVVEEKQKAEDDCVAEGGGDCSGPQDTKLEETEKADDKKKQKYMEGAIWCCYDIIPISPDPNLPQPPYRLRPNPQWMITHMIRE